MFMKLQNRHYNTLLNINNRWTVVKQYNEMLGTVAVDMWETTCCKAYLKSHWGLLPPEAPYQSLLRLPGPQLDQRPHRPAV